ncbi:MAG: signal peptide peptidase SppA [Opitutaceae bacterium]|nr:signal peptide peptidase SppA [Opitutaceae bacterium]|tara:strand:- start:4703 stop:6502 length:1800 start_codon:yes stop_codon:yes gene_type:complete
MWRFIQNTFSSLLGTLLALGILAFGGLFLLLIFIPFSQEPAVNLPDDAILVVDLSMSINDKPPSKTIDQVISEAISNSEIIQVSLRKLINAIKYAKTDNDIKGLYLTGSLQSINFGSGYAAMTEVRQALLDFKTSGKPIHAYMVNAMPRDYFVMSCADTIYMNPFGELMFNGLGVEMMFYANAFEKWGIGAQSVRVGTFKAGIEPYMQDHMSEENREQTMVLIEGIWDSMAAEVAESRGIALDELGRLVGSNRSFDANSAKEGGLVDELVYFDEILNTLKEVAGDDQEERTFAQIDIASYMEAKSVSGSSRSDNEVAVIYLEGVIVGGEGNPNQVGGDRIARRIRDVRLDDDVKAVVLRVNCPGGGAQAAEIIQREVRLLKETKPVVASMGYVAASGGYWVSTYSNRIFAQENTITGSIGVYGLIFNVQEIANNFGITWDYARTHEYAGSSTITRPQTEAELKQLEESTAWYYEKFLEKVAESRGMEIEFLDTVGQGRTWLGKDAIKHGLVDEIGGLDAAIEHAAELAKLEDYSIRDYPRGNNFDELLSAMFEGRDLDVSVDPATGFIRKLQKDLEWLKTFNDPQGIYLLPEINFQFFK